MPLAPVAERVEAETLAEAVAEQLLAWWGVVFRDIVARETLDEREILQVTGLPPAPALENERVAAATR